MGRFTRRRFRRQKAQGTPPTPQPATPRKQVTHQVPVRARCMGCGNIDPTPRWHQLVTLPEGEPAPEFVDPDNPYTSTLCDDCHAKHQAAMRARYGDAGYARAQEQAREVEREHGEE